MAGLLTAAVYAILGLALVGTRLTGLGHSFWHDEIVTVREFIRAGPTEIVAGPYIPNNHELFSLLAWVTTSAVGGSEIAFRLWSVIPFIIGVTAVSAWLHVRVNALSGVLFLFLATVSPLLLDLSRQARGYGLAFLAMSVLLVAALEADRSGEAWTIVAFCAAGVVGSATLPNFALAFVATGAVLLLDSRLRRRLAVGLFASLLTIAAWYFPHVDDLRASSRQTFGVQIDTAWVVTAPIDQVLIPGLLWIDDKAASPTLVWLPVIAVLLIPISASPLLRERRTAPVLVSGVILTVGVLWLTRTYVVPRFVSFLLVPLLILVASGSAAILSRFRRHPPLVGTVVVLTMLILLSAAFVWHAARIMRLPREAHKDAAELIRADAPQWSVLAYTYHPADLAFYLERPVKEGRSTASSARECARRVPIALVVQGPTPVMSVPCLRRAGTRHDRFEQYARGGEMNVWLIPARQ